MSILSLSVRAREKKNKKQLVFGNRTLLAVSAVPAWSNVMLITGNQITPRQAWLMRVGNIGGFRYGLMKICACIFLLWDSLDDLVFTMAPTWMLIPAALFHRKAFGGSDIQKCINQLRRLIKEIKHHNPHPFALLFSQIGQ